jgi:hypothetical protein
MEFSYDDMRGPTEFEMDLWATGREITMPYINWLRVMGLKITITGENNA